MSDALIGVQLTKGEWDGLLAFVIRNGMSRFNDTYRSMLMQVEHGSDEMSNAHEERQVQDQVSS